MLVSGCMLTVFGKHYYNQILVFKTSTCWYIRCYGGFYNLFKIYLKSSHHQVRMKGLEKNGERLSR